MAVLGMDPLIRVRLVAVMLACALALLVGSSFPIAASPAGLHVQGNRLSDAFGGVVQLHGVGRSGTEYRCIQGYGIFDGPSDQASITAIKGWNTNAVRVPLNEDCWLAINGAPAAYSGAAYQQAIKDFVSLINQNDMYAIVELHWSAPGATKATGQQPMPDLDHAPAFWSSVATAFKSNPAVIFEPFNEPWPDNGADSVAGWTCWRDGGTCPGVSFQVAGMQTLVNTIRATGAQNVIALGGVRWSNALSQWLAYKPTDPANGLLAAWHIYEFNACNSVSCYNGAPATVAAQVPLLATELGSHTCDATFLNGLMSWMDSKQSGYMAWAWDTWGSACSTDALITNYSGTATAYGQIIRNHLAALPTPTPTSTPVPTPTPVSTPTPVPTPTLPALPTPTLPPLP